MRIFWFFLWADFCLLLTNFLHIPLILFKGRPKLFNWPNLRCCRGILVFWNKFESILVHSGLTRVRLMAGCEKKCKFLKIFFFFHFFIIKSIKMKSGQHTLPIWKGLSVLNTHILIWNEDLWNWGHNANENECNFFLIRLYICYHMNCNQISNFFLPIFFNRWLWLATMKR